LTRTLPAAAALAVFVTLATANGGGYRYGISDQAFYIPAVLHAADPATFPRDRALIDAQARLLVADEALAAAMHATGLPLPALFAAAYLASLVIVFAALVLIGRSLYASPWTLAALLAAFTLRHQITRTSANTFEPYFHPRMLAFGVCALAVAAMLRKRPLAAIALVAAGGVVHPTTAAWFAILVGAAIVVADDRLRRPLLAAATIACAGAAWAFAAGPLAPSLAVMDAPWRAALVSKTTLFATEWPASAWIANLGTATLWGWAYFDRRRQGGASAEDTGLAAGGAALLAIFLVTLPLVAAGVAFVVQLQISRVFWLIDFFATIYALGALERRGRPLLVPAVTIALLVFATARGVFVLWVEHPERRLFATRLAETPWHDAMRWLAAQPAGVHVLADPGHAWRYGSSVRVSAGRDVFLEDVKDAAIAIYSREVALRVVERSNAIGDFSRLTEDRARELAARYDLDYLVSTAALRLPVAYRNAEFAVYSLAPGPVRGPG
jgi:hypothetical protein